jgi:leucyl-tRNA synthetase
VLFDLGRVRDPEPFMKLVHQGMILGEDGEKMSKARGNVVNPDDIVRAHGADVLRLYEMFMGPLDAVKPWQAAQIQGMVRFRDRVYAALKRPIGETIDPESRKLLHKTIKKVTLDIEAMAFNTAISAMMVFTNHLHSLTETPREAAEALAKLISPFAPHLGEELWLLLGHTVSLSSAPWPDYDDALCHDDVVEMAVQVNGKVRGRVMLGLTATADEAQEAALAAEGVAQAMGGKSIRKLIYVPGRIINLVVG